MADLEILRPEVREAFAVCEAQLPDHDSDGTPNAWYHVRAELLRLADENKRMRGIIETLDIEGHRRAEKAEAELAALKARIAEAPEVRISGLRILTDTEEDARSAMAAWCTGTKRVHLLVDEPPAGRGEG